MPLLPFTGFLGDYQERTPKYQNTELTQNLYYESPGSTESGRSGGALLSTPGLARHSWLTVEFLGPVMGIATVSQYLAGQVTPLTTYVVVGRGAGNNPALYRLNNDHSTPTFISVLPFTGKYTGLVRIIPGNSYLVIIDASLPYTYGVFYYYGAGAHTGSIGPIDAPYPPPPFPPSNSFAAGWHAPADGDFMDGYWIFAEAGTQTFFISNYQVPSEYDALDFAVEDDLPDSMVALRAVNGRVWVFGRQRMVAWYNSGAAAFPFSRDNSSRIDIGAVNPTAMVKMENTLFWLGRDPYGGVRVFMLDGYVPVAVSTPAEESIWQAYSNVEDAYAWVYQQEGHSFYLISFPTANTSFCYDRKENRWHRRSSFNSTTGQQEVHAGTCCTYNPLLGGHIVGDRGTSTSYLMSRQVFTDFDVSITRRRISPHVVTLGSQRASYNRFVLDTNTTHAQLSYSNDYGQTYNTLRNPDIVGSDHAEWVRCGSTRTDRVFQVQIVDDNNPVVISGASLDIEVEG
jgi:hypothetical protein